MDSYGTTTIPLELFDNIFGHLLSAEDILTLASLSMTCHHFLISIRKILFTRVAFHTNRRHHEEGTNFPISMNLETFKQMRTGPAPIDSYVKELTINGSYTRINGHILVACLSRFTALESVGIVSDRALPDNLAEWNSLMRALDRFLKTLLQQPNIAYLTFKNVGLIPVEILQVIFESNVTRLVLEDSYFDTEMFNSNPMNTKLTDLSIIAPSINHVQMVIASLSIQTSTLTRLRIGIREDPEYLTPLQDLFFAVAPQLEELCIDISSTVISQLIGGLQLSTFTVSFKVLRTLFINILCSIGNLLDEPEVIEEHSYLANAATTLNQPLNADEDMAAAMLNPYTKVCQNVAATFQQSCDTIVRIPAFRTLKQITFRCKPLHTCERTRGMTAHYNWGLCTWNGSAQKVDESLIDIRVEYLYPVLSDRLQILVQALKSA